MSALAVSKLVKAVENSSCFLVLWEKPGSGHTMDLLKDANVASSVNNFIPGDAAVVVEHATDFVAPTLCALTATVNENAGSDELARHVPTTAAEAQLLQASAQARGAWAEIAREFRAAREHDTLLKYMVIVSGDEWVVQQHFASLTSDNSEARLVVFGVGVEADKLDKYLQTQTAKAHASYVALAVPRGAVSHV